MTAYYYYLYNAFETLEFSAGNSGNMGAETELKPIMVDFPSEIFLWSLSSCITRARPKPTNFVFAAAVE